MGPPRERAEARIIDANLNRIAEALRVAEDICRFGWGLPGLSRELKDLRHDVLRAFAPDPEARVRLTASRDIEEDVGRDAAAREHGADLAGAAVRNLQRAKEALRTLEEVARAAGGAGGDLGPLRYRLYSIEKGVLRLASRPRGRMAGVQLYLLATASLSRIPLARAVEAAIAGGAGAVQLREKSLSDRDLLERAALLREVTARSGAVFIVNDRPDIARLSGADGVHLGQGDIPVAAARAILGEDLLVGVSTHGIEEARRAAREGADSIGIGPVFETTTKAVGRLLGPAGLREIVEAVDVPAFAVGGVRPENARLLAEAGCARAAVSSAVLGAGGPEEIEAAARRICEGLASRGDTTK